MVTRYSRTAIVQNISWLFIDRIARAIGGLITIAMLARHLGASEFGKYNYVLAIVGITGVLAGLGLKDSLIRRFVKSECDLFTLIINSFHLRLVSGFFGIVVSVIAILILRADEPDVVFLCIAMAISLLFQSSDIFKYWFESQLRSKVVVIAESSVIYTFLVVKLVLIVFDSPLIVFGVALTIETLSQFLVMLFIYSKLHSFRIAFTLDPSIVRKLVYESVPLLLSGIIIITTIHIDKILIGTIFDDKMVGVFSVASQLFLFTMSFIVVFEVSLYPKFVHESGDTQLTLKNIGLLYRRINQIQIALIIVCFLFSGYFIRFVFGTDFAACAQLFNYLMLTSVVITFARAFDQFHKTVGQFKYIAFRQFSILVLNVVFFLLLAPHFGLVSVVVASGFSYFSVVVSTVFWGPRRQDIRRLYRCILGF